MCMFRNARKNWMPVYTYIKHTNFFSTELRHTNLDTIDMSYKLYESNVGDITSHLIIMHGLFGSKSNWNSLCKALHQKTQCSILCVDARNHGESPHSSDHSYEHLTEDVRVLFDRKDIKKSSLLGHSMGGRAMMYFALKYPNLVDKLVVVDVSPVSSSSSLNSMLDLFNIMENLELPYKLPISAARVELDKELSNSIPDQGVRAFLLTNLKQNSDGSLAWRINLEALRTNFVEHISRFPKMDNLKYNGPVLFIAGENSDYIRESDHSEILKHFPNAEFKTVSGAGHWLHSEKPEEFLQLTTEFLIRNE